ncbi:MAG: SAM-dependent methyltransferase, partial [Alphaproteobacteria bacterium]|nr:SAM-dependent methyltransferase [Alphaproteobacteria bacterium]
MNAIDPRRGKRPLSVRRPPRSGAVSAFARMIGPQFHRLLDRIDQGLEQGAIDATLPDGTRRLLGGRAPGPECTVHLLHWRALLRLATGGSSGWYRAW